MKVVSSFIILLIPQLAWGLPSPDTLITSAQFIGPWLVACMAALVGSVVWGRELLARLPYRWQVRTLTLLLVVFCCSVMLILRDYWKQQEQDRLEILAGYFQGDSWKMTDESHAQENFSQWLLARPHLQLLGRQDKDILHNHIKLGHIISFFDVGSYLLHESGRPIIELNGLRIASTHLFPAELLATLKAFSRGEDVSKRVLLFRDANFLKLRTWGKQATELREILSRFAAVYAFAPLESSDILLFEVKELLTGKVTSANSEYKSINFPVRTDERYLDHRGIHFPKAFEILNNQYLSDALAEGAIIIAPYEGRLRSASHQRYYLQHYLGKYVGQSIMVDFSSSSIRKDIIPIFEFLASQKQKVVIAAVGRDDGLELGQDFMLLYYHWLNAKNRSSQFRYIGLNYTLASFGAALAQNTASHLLQQQTREQIFQMLTILGSGNRLAGIFLFHALIFVLGYPCWRLIALSRQMRRLHRKGILKLGPAAERLSAIIAVGIYRGPQVAQLWTMVTLLVCLFGTWLYQGESGIVWRDYLIWLASSQLFPFLGEARLRYMENKMTSAADWARTLAGKPRTFLGERATTNKARGLTGLLPLSGKWFHVPATTILNETSPVVESLPDSLYAVRSSAHIEDQHNSSAAGRFLSKLAVKKEHLPQAMADVFKSMGSSGGQVLLQPQLNFSVSGVLFTRGIEAGQHMQVEWVHGHLAGLVGGIANGHSALIGKASMTVDGEWQGMPSWLAARLWLIGYLCESLYGEGQDIEWGVDQQTKQLYILQVRPITVKREISWRDKLAEDKRWTSLSSLDRGSVILTADGLEELQGLSDADLSIAQQIYGADRLLSWQGRVWLKTYATKFSWGKLFKLCFHTVYRATLPRHYLKWWYQRLAKQETLVHSWQLLDWLAQQSGKFTISGLDCQKIFSLDVPCSVALMQDRWQYQMSEMSAEQFITRWGHRSLHDYHPASPCFKDVLPPALIKHPQWKKSEMLDGWAFLKEWARDCWFRQHLKTAVTSELQFSKSDLPMKVNLLEWEGVGRYSVEGDWPAALAAHRGASGKLVDEEMLLRCVRDKVAGPFLLWSPTLTPQLADYFPLVEGIFAVTAGRLSHAAIVARELGRPVWSGKACSALQTHLGQEIVVNREGKWRLAH